jgi:hypothetical protein
MRDVSVSGVAEALEDLVGYPFLFYAREEWPSAGWCFNTASDSEGCSTDLIRSYKLLAIH